MIDVQGLTKVYRVHVRQPGLAASLRSLWHREYREVRAVDGIDFHIPEGQIVGFLGPNGAGKTTTMKLLTGLLHPTSGQIKVGGFIPFQQQNAFKKRVSLVMGQKSQLIWDIPASETFLIHKEVYDIAPADYRRRIDYFTEMLDLSAVIDKPVRQLSLGERMKCELVAALLHRPDLVFLDEPTIGLDVNMQEAMRRFIASYNREYKATILLTSHYMADVSALCERVLVINHGKLLYDGAISKLIDRFSPSKRIALVLGDPVAAETVEAAVHSGGGRLVSYAYPQLEVEAPREDVTGLSAKLLTSLPVVDLTIEDPSLESVIGMAYAKTEDPQQQEQADLPREIGV
ncbi:ATP-binding cassette domain-containing protein [Paenibacillus sp. CF384]|uniref:ABC transporter ATP-binding protein n=1 Tax=Paenibacillus sp. CF384 TaxID=1884382 RepID=UPI000899C902|nr:ABC transporter ATP-binding protein [Paenibacillus sp. CF384]SDW54077.1 ABC-2 type transport system ATP-binding protein [Paenibacillus sp. CF384]